MKNKCDLLMELIFWETYVDNQKMASQMNPDFCFYSTRNNINSLNQNQTNKDFIKKNKKQQATSIEKNSKINFNELTKKNEVYQYDMDHVFKNNSKRLTFNIKFPQLKKKNSRISTDYTPLSKQIMNQQSDKIYDLQKKFLFQSVNKKSQQNLQDNKISTRNEFMNIQYDSIDTKDVSLIPQTKMNFKKKMRQTYQKFQETLHFPTDDTQRSKQCETEEINLTVTRLENEKVKLHYPITQNDVTCFLNQQKNLKNKEDKPQEQNFIYYKKKSQEKSTQQYDIKEFSLHKLQKLSDDHDDDDLLYYMLKDKSKIQN